MKDSSKIFNVRVTTRARQSAVTEKDGVLYVRTNAVPENGRANTAVIELLAKYFDVPKSQIKISKGVACRDKVVTIG